MDDHRSASPASAPPARTDWDRFSLARTSFLRMLARDSETFRLERALAAPAVPEPALPAAPERRSRAPAPPRAALWPPTSSRHGGLA